MSHIVSGAARRPRPPRAGPVRAGRALSRIACARNQEKSTLNGPIRHYLRRYAASLTTAGGYRYGGRDYDRGGELAAIAAGLSGRGLEHVIYLPFRDVPCPAGALSWERLLGTPAGEAASPSAMASPASLDAFVQYACTQHDYASG